MAIFIVSRHGFNYAPVATHFHIPSAALFIHSLPAFPHSCPLFLASSSARFSVDRNTTQFVIFNLLNYHKMQATQFIFMLAEPPLVELRLFPKNCGSLSLARTHSMN